MFITTKVILVERSDQVVFYYLFCNLIVTSEIIAILAMLSKIHIHFLQHFSLLLVTTITTHFIFNENVSLRHLLFYFSIILFYNDLLISQ